MPSRASVGLSICHTDFSQHVLKVCLSGYQFLKLPSAIPVICNMSLMIMPVNICDTQMNI